MNNQWKERTIRMFKQDIARTIWKVLKAEKFKMISYGKYEVYFFKRYSEELAFYVFCHDNRGLNKGIRIYIYFVPIQIPDGAITRLPAGITLRIAEVYDSEVSDEVMIAVGKKIVATVKGLEGFAGMVLKELETPYFPNDRWSFFQKILLVYNTINEDPNLKEEVEAIKSHGCKVVKKKSTEIYAMCSELVDKLPQDYFAKVGVDWETGKIKDQLWRHFEAQCLLDA